MTDTATLDPFAEIAAAARRQAAEESALKQLSHARAKLVLGKTPASVFFATLALRLKPMPSWEIDTAATDGDLLLINPDWFSGLSPAERIAVVAHEVMHPAMQHHARRGSRDPRRWNIAADCAINPLLRDAGFNLPQEGCFPGEGPLAELPVGLSSEEYYALLPEQFGDGSGNDPGGCGGVMDAANDAAGRAEASAQWQVAVAAAVAASKQRGALPQSIQRIVDEILQPKVDWRAVLAEFVRSYARNDYTWSRPNRRFIHQGIYLPSLHSEQIGDIVIAIDTSGSIDSDTLNAFAAECEGVLSAYDCTATIVYCDCAIQHVQQWRRADGPLVMQPVGGGGTSHRPLWNWLDQQPEQPECVICLTDGQTDFGNDPGLPVLWCLTEECHVPFGRKLLL